MDLRHVPLEVLAGYPRLMRALERGRLDPARDVLEVGPAAHHFMGGVRIDERCWTGIPGLYAAGENAGGVHGANRMAGNSGPDGLVFGRIAGIEAARTRSSVGARPRGKNAAPRATPRSSRAHAAARQRIRRLMMAEAGFAREPDGLERARCELIDLWRSVGRTPMCPDQADVLSLVTSALTVVTGALLRKESRGAHYRLDHPAPDDRRYLGSFAIRLERPGDPSTLIHRWLPRAERSTGTPTAEAR